MTVINGKKRHKTYHLRGRVWIEGEEGTFLGYGRVILLERIKALGSISYWAVSDAMQDFLDEGTKKFCHEK